MTALEIAVTSVAGAVTAREHGATRIELCSALEVGGVTPSQGLVTAVLDEVGEPEGDWQGVHVLVRPRPGGFVYDRAEADLYEDELDAVIEQYPAGVVIGALTTAGEPDLRLVSRLAGVAHHHDLTVTFHRAVDRTRDPVSAVAALDGIVDRVLTSGGAPSADDGVETIAAMVRAGGPAILAGGGLTPRGIPALVAAGVEGVHLSAKRVVRGAGGTPLGTADDGSHWVTDPELVAAARSALRP